MEKGHLVNLYIDKQMSMSEISTLMGFSVHKVEYWLKRYEIERRSRSEAVYIRANGGLDPFKIKAPVTPEEFFLKGLALGIYWGEGNKKNVHSIKLGNTDPELILSLRKYLIELCGVNPKKIKYSLQIFSDTDPEVALNYWFKCLQVGRESFTEKVTITKSGKVGTYKTKNLFGVCTIYVHNRKLRDIIVNDLRKPM